MWPLSTSEFGVRNSTDCIMPGTIYDHVLDRIKFKLSNWSEQESQWDRRTSLTLPRNHSTPGHDYYITGAKQTGLTPDKLPAPDTNHSKQNVCALFKGIPVARNFPCFRTFSSCSQRTTAHFCLCSRCTSFRGAARNLSHFGERLLIA